MKRPALERFSEKVVIDPATGCHVWQAALDSKGYGCFRDERGVTVRAPRWIYQQLVGPISAGLQLDHLCRNRACVNVAHLEPVTARENSLRGEGIPAINAQKTHCINGHPLDMVEGNRRRCRTCKREAHRRYKLRTRLARAAA